MFQWNFSNIDWSQPGITNTRDEIIQILNSNPEQKQKLLTTISTVGDDSFLLPQDSNDHLAIKKDLNFNHSCDPNCGFIETLDSRLFIFALRDIYQGEELTYDYQCLEVETSFYNGLNCKCNSYKCRGVLKFNEYRNIDWRIVNYDNCSLYVKRKINELESRWFASTCCLRYYPSDNNSGKELGLTARTKIRRDELVAVYSDETVRVNKEEHYIRHRNDPNCYLSKNKVYAFDDIEAGSELTLRFS